MRWLAYSVLGIWGFLLAFWGKYWKGGPWLPEEDAVLASYPDILIIVPARNEEDSLPTSLKSLLAQDYKGKFQIILVDDQSEDSTKELAYALAKKDSLLKIVDGKEKPQGWSGKLWALHQALVFAKEKTPTTKKMIQIIHPKKITKE